MRIKRRCKNCGAVIDMSKDRHYVLKHENREGLYTNVVYFDAFDCQECGCQYLVGVREIEKVKEEN